MAHDVLVAADLANINDVRAVDLGMSDIFDGAPLLRTLAAVTASNGNVHKYLKESGAPTVGFRAIGAGRDHDSSVDTIVTENLAFLDASFTVDEAAVKGYGRAGSLIERELRRHLKAAFFKAEQQIVNGTTDGDAAGFTGLSDALDALADATVIGAGGTTALSSVYAIYTGEMDCALVLGNDGQIDVGETVLQRVDKVADGTAYMAYVTAVSAWYGLQVGTARSIGRIANLDAGSNTLTDDRISQLLETFPADQMPNLLVMGKRSLGQLQRSRTSYSPTGAPAEIPNSAFNIPIVVTDAIGVAETQVT